VQAAVVAVLITKTHSALQVLAVAVVRVSTTGLVDLAMLGVVDQQAETAAKEILAAVAAAAV
jgi:hypothetical protein